MLVNIPQDGDDLQTYAQNFTATCVTYYQNTTNFMFKINGSNPMAQFMVINNRMEIRAHDRSRVTIPSAFHQKKSSFEWQNLDQLTKWPFQTILGPLQLQTWSLVIAQMKPY